MTAASQRTQSSSIIRLFARVVKLVYTAGLKPAAANHGMPVRFRSLAPHPVRIAPSLASPALDRGSALEGEGRRVRGASSLSIAPAARVCRQGKLIEYPVFAAI